MKVFRGLVATGEHARREVDDVDEPNDAEQVVRRVMDSPGLDGFQWKVWLVAGSGFFTTSYSIFSTNMVGPALEYVYNGHSYSSTIGSNGSPYAGTDCSVNDYSTLVINLTTLGGIIVGMLLFGFLADMFGRKSVYGAELMIVIVATLGLTEATSGRGDYMNIFGWIGFFRFLLGIGIGAEYPLSAIIAAEWSSTRSRARMMTAVFLMQSLGQIAAYALALLVLYLVNRSNGLDPSEMDRSKTEPMIDAFWRIVVGIGALPALIAIGLRRIVPETPLWLAVKSHPADATRAVGAVYSYSPDEEFGNVHARRYQVADGDDDDDERGLIRRMLDGFARLGRYLAENDRWRAFLGVCIVWFLLDLAFYGLGLDNPQTISSIWQSSAPNATTVANSTTCLEPWRTDLSQPDISIYNVLIEDALHNIITISTGTVAGSVIILLVIDYIPRVTWMACWFLGLGVLFLINGSTLFVAFESDRYALTITLFVLTQTMFNLGPNTITFILPAELFGTRYRGTLYGLAAAAGKLGAIVIQVILQQTIQGDLAKGSGGKQLAGLLLGLCPAMLLGALVTWVWIPEVQYPRGGYGRTRGSTGRRGRGGGSDIGDDEHDDENYDDRSSSDDGEYERRSGEGGEGENGGGDGMRRRSRVGREGFSFSERLQLPSRPLEEIARYPSEGQVIGFRKNIGWLWQAVRGKTRGEGGRRTKARGASAGSTEGAARSVQSVEMTEVVL